MSLPNISSYEIKISRNNKRIPVINGVHLHSAYNPEKEAENFILTHIENLKKKNEVLILGLGFGYHVNSVAEQLTSYHGDKFKIIVIEPNIQVYNDCMSLDLLNKKNVLVYSGLKSTDLFNDLNLIHFLLRKPVIMAHPASFNLYQDYFKNFLTFEAPQKIREILSFIKSNEIKEYLSFFDTEATLEEVMFNELPLKGQLSQMDFLAMALVEITKKTHESNLKSEAK